MGVRNLLVKVGLAAGKVAAKFDPSGIAAGLLDAYSKHEEKKQLRSEIEEMVSAGFEQFRGELGEAMGELKSQLPESMRPQVEAYLSQFQTSAKQASRAFGDPSGTTVPVTVAVDEPEQLAAFLPQRPPRFVVGDSVPGLPSWKLTEPLGAGGFGEVWRAENPYSGTAAFKFFLDPTARNRFTRTEALNLAEIFKRAPTDGVVKLLMAEPGQEPPWLQFEYISGGDLSRLLESWKRKSDQERITQAGGVLRALARTVGHFHNLGVVHRDLKPSNILLRKTDAGYKLVVADFGISKIVPVGLSSLPTPANSGTATIRAYTALYASPQQKKFRPADRRDDVYALGVLWYQLLRSDLNLERPSGEGWKRALKNLGVSDATVTLLNRCWDDEPDERPADGNALLDAIRQLDPQPAQAPVPVTKPPQPTVAAASVPIVLAPPPKPPLLPDVRSVVSPPAPVNVVNESRAPDPAPSTPVNETSPTEPAAELTVEEAIRQFENAGGHRGTTATAGHQYYETASQLRFMRCRCAWEDADHNAHEFIARNARGTCYYVTHNLRTHKIAITTQGYHRSHDAPECVPGSAPRSRSEPPSTEVPPARILPRTGRVLEERDITPRGTWLVELPEWEDDEQQNEDDSPDSEDGIADESDEEDDEDSGWHIVCFTPARTEIREGELYYFRLAPRGMGDLLGLDALATLEQLRAIHVVNEGAFPAAGCALLTGFQHLRTLSFSECDIDDAALQYFAGLTALTTLDLSGTMINGSGLKHLAGLQNLETLNLSDTALPHDALAALPPLSKLECLLLKSAGELLDLSSLAALSNLKVLDLELTKLAGVDFAPLSACSQLEHLSLYCTGITDAVLPALSKIGGLRSLCLSGCKGITDSGMYHLSRLTNLESLDLDYTDVSNAGIAQLSGLVGLSSLSLTKCKLTDGVVKHLRTLTRLETLDLNGTKVTPKGVRELRASLPVCDVRGI